MCKPIGFISNSIYMSLLSEPTEPGAIISALNYDCVCVCVKQTKSDAKMDSKMEAKCNKQDRPYNRT